MLHQMLRGKIHRATVTEACLDYEGSLSVDPKLMSAAGMVPNEKILVANVENGERFETYLIEGKPGEICINGAAAHLGKKGDKVIVMCFALYDDAELAGYKPMVVHVDSENNIV